MSKQEIEAKLRRIGARRKRHTAEGDAIQSAVAEVVEEARGEVPIQRAADLLGMHRSSIYELYIGGSTDDSEPAKSGGSQAGQRSTNGQSTTQGRTGKQTSVVR